MSRRLTCSDARTPGTDPPGLSVLGCGLAQKRARRLLQDPPPGARALALLGEVADDLAHARSGDLDPVLGADGAQPVVVLRELQRDRLEAVSRDVDALREVHDVRVEHQLV